MLRLLSCAFALLVSTAPVGGCACDPLPSTPLDDGGTALDDDGGVLVDDDGGGNSGDDAGNNTSDDDAGNTSNDDDAGNNSNDDDAGSTSNDDDAGSNSGDDDAGNTSNDDDAGSTSNDDDAGSNANDDDAGSDSGDDDAGNTSDDDAGSTSNDDDAGSNANDDDAGNTSGDDAGSVVAPGMGDVWMRIDYRNAYTPRSPRYSYSDTPGWGEAEWAATDMSWPEIFAWGSVSVDDDPINAPGEQSLLTGSSGVFQIMIGLQDLIAYDRVEVVLSGRSRATSSSATFDVYNPWNGCGVSGVTISNDWTPDVIVMDLADCMDIGQGVQAIRVEPINGQLAVLDVTVSLYGAEW